MTAFKSYVICTSPRSGSTLLCRLLAQTGRTGKPGSHFHTPSMAAWLQAYDLSPATYPTELDQIKAVFAAAILRGTQDTGIFGLRLQRDSFDFFMQQLGRLHPGLANDHDRFTAAFGPTLFIYLSRQDKLGQAISLTKANQTGLWHKSVDGSELERTAPHQDPVYDGDEITRQLDRLTKLDQDWRDWFAAENIAPLAISYEDLSAAPTKVLTQIFSQLGLPPDLVQGIAPNVAKLADATSQEWAERFVKENRAP
ncbi:MAG: Stf0 family sulfotransferase [Marinosulfonomonas sp.]